MASNFTMESMYSFIRDINGGASHREWIKLADANGDGTLIKSEFTKWIEEELPAWTGVEAYQAKGVIENFWYGLDTNRSADHIEGTRLSNLHAVSEEEMVDMEIRLQKMDEYYEILSIIEAPKNLSFENRVRWVTEVREKLSDKMDDLLDKGKKVSEDSEVYEEYKKVVMEVTPSIAIDDMQTDCASIFAKYAYDIRTSEDKEQLLELVESYIQDNLAKIAGNSQGFAYGTVDAVETFVKDFMSEAMLEDELKAKYSSYTYKDATGFVGYSELQRKVLSTDLYDELTSDADWSPVLKNEGASKESDIIKALKGFTDDILDDTPNAFETIYNDKVNTFKNHDIVQEHGIDYYIDKMQSATIKTVIDADVETALKSAGLTAEQSAILSDFILNASNASVREDVANDLINDIKTYSRTDAKDSPAIKNALANELVKYGNVEDMFADGYPAGYEIKDLDNLHDGRFKLIEKNSKHEAALQSYIDYCESLIAKGGLYKEAVIAVNQKYEYLEFNFPEVGEPSLVNNATASTSMTSTIKNILIPEIRKYTDPVNWTITWGKSEFIGRCGINKSFTVAAQASVFGETIDEPGFEYSIASSEVAGATITPEGKISLTVPTTEGRYAITVNALKDGVVVSTKEITLIASNSASAINEDDYPRYGKDEYVEAGWYTNNDYNHEPSIRDAAVVEVFEAIDEIYGALVRSGNYNKEALDIAVADTQEFFDKLVHSMSAHYGVKNGQWDDIKVDITMEDGRKYKEYYQQESHQGYIWYDKNCYDGSRIQWTRGTMAGARFAKITIQKDVIFDWFSTMYGEAAKNIVVEEEPEVEGAEGAGEVPGETPATTYWTGTINVSFDRMYLGSVERSESNYSITVDADAGIDSSSSNLDAALVSYAYDVLLAQFATSYGADIENVVLKSKYKD